MLETYKSCEFDTQVWKIHWSIAWQLTPVLLLGESQGQRSLEGLQSMGSQKKSDTIEET